MKVNGMLEGAQLELLASENPTPAAPGRVYADKTTPTNIVPYIHNGTAWRPFLLGQSEPTVSQNSGKAVNVDWSLGLYQKVVLTAGCVISFSNPQEGQIHTLIVQQAPASASTLGTLYPFTFDMKDQETSKENFQPDILGTGKSKAFSWFYQEGLEAAYTTIPATYNFAMASVGTVAAPGMISPEGNYLLIGKDSSPFVDAINLNRKAPVPNVTPIGIKNATTPVAAAAATLSVAYHPNGLVAFAVGGTSPYLQAWGLLNGAPQSPAWSNPATLPTGVSRCIGVYPTGAYIAVGHSTTPFMSVYPCFNNSFGAKLTDPASLPATTVNSIAFSPQGDYLAVFSALSPYLEVYAFSNIAGSGSIGAKAANPSTLPPGIPGGAQSLAWRPQGDYIALANSTTPYLYVVPFNRTLGTFGVPLTVTTIPSAALTIVKWSACGTYLICGGAVPGLWVYDFSNFTLDTQVTFDGSAPNDALRTLNVHPNNDFILLSGSGNILSALSLPRRQKNYLRLS